jgi:metallo-beta-lactamase family protein
MAELSFHGGVREVTGSCYLFEYQDTSVLIDCGMHQGEQKMCASINREEFDFDIASINAVFITHAHYDHTGRLPLLVKRGYKGPIYMTPPTLALVREILIDAARILHYDAKKCGNEPLFDQSDVNAMLDQCEVLPYHTELPAGSISAMFFDAGHILGSAFIRLRAGESSLVFSGDLGNTDIPILPDTEQLPGCEALIVESTYGDKEHEPTNERANKLKEAVNTILERRGTVLIPAFSIERTQELLYTLDRLHANGEIPHVPVYLDSPLAIKATQAYRKYSQYLEFDESVLVSDDRDFFSFPGLRITPSVDDSKSINDDQRPKIIIAGSGMMSGGRIIHHLMRYLSDHKSGVIIIGYQAEGTLGRSIQDGAKQVKIYDKQFDVEASIHEVEAFSAHADRAKVAEWILAAEKQPKDIYLVHGDPETKEVFSEYLKTRGITASIHIPGYHDEFSLEESE